MQGIYKDVKVMEKKRGVGVLFCAVAAAALLAPRVVELVFIRLG